MVNSVEAPWLTGMCTPQAGLQQAGEALWRSASHVRRGGDWRPEELRTYEHRAGRVAIVGACLASSDEFAIAARQALEQQDAVALANLPGNYTSIMHTDNGLDIIGDRVDQRPLYVRSDARGVSFSTHMRRLFNDSGTLLPDPLSLAVAIGTPWRYELAEGRTAAYGVERSSARHRMHIDRNGSIHRIPYDVLPPTGLNSAETAAALRAAMLDAARRRVATGRALSSDFSGGFDSTSAAYVLAHQLDQPLIAVTLHSPDIPVDDIQYARAYMQLPESARKFVHHIHARWAADTMYNGIFDVPATDAPCISTRTLVNVWAHYGNLRSLGSDLHIEGTGADNLFGMSPRKYLGSQAMLGAMPQLAEAIMQTARSERSSPQRVEADIWRNARSSPSAELQALARVLPTLEADGESLDSLVFGAATAPQWLKLSMRKEVSDYAASVADDVTLPEGMDLATYRTYMVLLSFGPAELSTAQIAGSMGLRQQSPYMDNDVLKLCFGLPAHARMNPWEFKPLLRQAMQGIVPDAVLRRTTKGDYTKHAYQGLRAAAPDIRRLLTDMRLADLGIVDPSKVRRVFEQGLAGATMPWASFDALLAHEWWLRSLDGANNVSTSAAPSSQSISVTPSEVRPPTEPLDDRQQFSTPPGVVIATHAYGAGLINMNRNVYERLNRAARDIVVALQSADSLRSAHGVLARMYPSLDPDQLRATTEDCIQDLLKRGILAKGDGAYAVLDGVMDNGGALPAQMVRVREQTPRVRTADYDAARKGMELMKQSGGVASVTEQKRLLDELRSSRVRREASAKEARRMLAAAHRVADASSERVACLELALTTALGSALLGRHVDVVLGIRTDPEGYHAWPEVGGEAIATSADEQAEGVYSPLIRL